VPIHHHPVIGSSSTLLHAVSRGELSLHVGTASPILRTLSLSSTAAASTTVASPHSGLMLLPSPTPLLAPSASPLARGRASDAGSRAGHSRRSRASTDGGDSVLDALPMHKRVHSAAEGVEGGTAAVTTAAAATSAAQRSPTSDATNQVSSAALVSQWNAVQFSADDCIVFEGIGVAGAALHVCVREHSAMVSDNAGWAQDVVWVGHAPFASHASCAHFRGVCVCVCMYVCVACCTCAFACAYRRDHDHHTTPSCFGLDGAPAWDGTRTRHCSCRVRWEGGAASVILFGASLLP